MFETMSCVLVIIYMFISAVQDIRYRTISLKLSLLFAICGAVCCIAKQSEISDIIKALIPGICILLLSLISGGCVGIGDAVFVMVCGFYMKPEHVLLAALTGWTACAAAALVIAAKEGMGGVCRSHAGLPYTAFAALPAAVMKLYMLMK